VCALRRDQIVSECSFGNDASGDLEMKASVFIATSLDGYIARPDGNLDWLFATAPSGGEAAEDYGYSEFIATVDTIVMGRNTYEKVRTFDAWPYHGKQVVVLTTRPLDIPVELLGSLRTVAGSPPDVVTDLVARGVKHAYVDGGQTIRGFLDAGLLDRLIVSTVPVIIGDGISLFGRTRTDIRLALVRTRTYATGLVQNEYAIPSPP
jgi:dihydrofolate reductase